MGKKYEPNLNFYKKLYYLCVINGNDYSRKLLQIFTILLNTDMAKEIEKKYLVKNDNYKCLSSVTYIQQGYITTKKEGVVRVRVKDSEGYITIKGQNQGAVRLEYEYEIPVSEAKEIIENLCQKPVVEKKRYTYKADDGHLWEIDEFFGENEGLVVAEIELSTEDEEYVVPDWIGEDVTFDMRYYNSNLLQNPYKNWNK